MNLTSRLSGMTVALHQRTQLLLDGQLAHDEKRRRVAQLEQSLVHATDGLRQAAETVRQLGADLSAERAVVQDLSRDLGRAHTALQQETDDLVLTRALLVERTEKLEDACALLDAERLRAHQTSEQRAALHAELLAATVAYDSRVAQLERDLSQCNVLQAQREGELADQQRAFQHQGADLSEQRADLVRHKAALSARDDELTDLRLILLDRTRMLESSVVENHKSALRLETFTALIAEQTAALERIEAQCAAQATELLASGQRITEAEQKCDMTAEALARATSQITAISAAPWRYASSMLRHRLRQLLRH